MDIERRIQAYLRVAAARGRDTERFGPLLATYTPDDENPYCNYAIPDDGAAPTPAEVAALIAAGERRGRRARLEYLTGLAPAVEPALTAAGFVAEGRTPLMICAPGEEGDPPAPVGVELVTLSPDSAAADLRGAGAAQAEAFGGPAGEGCDEEAERLRRNLREGTIAVIARDPTTGRCVGAGVCTAPADGLTEVAGIGVRPAYRRRGIAAALTARLAREAFASGGVTLAFLMAAGEAEARIYARAGFRTVGDVLHISRPLAGAGGADGA